MLFINRHPGSGGIRPVVGAVASVVVLLVMLALPASAHEETRLSHASVGPRIGTPATTIRFAVTYRGHDDDEPEYVRVIIDGSAHEMTTEGTRWKKGVVYHYSTKLGVGVHQISFEARDEHDGRERIRAGSVKIKAEEKPAKPDATRAPTPAPTPRHTPEPTRAPAPKPKPTPEEQPAPRPTPTPQSGGGTGGTVGSGGGSDPGSGPGGSDGGKNPGHVAGGPGPVVGDGSPAGGSADNPGRTTGDGADGGVGAIRGASDSVGDGWGELASALDTLGLGPDAPFLSLAPTLVGTTGAVTMAMAFAIFGKKRRDEKQPASDEVLRAQAARASAVSSSGALVRGGPGNATLVHDVVRNAAVPVPVDAESTMPRWRRPSLMEARKADPRRTASALQPLSFADSRVEPAKGYERRTIRYRVVRLLDAPDELRSADIGQLDQGDEVQLIEKWGAYWLVLCPDGRQGWLHKMTLGDVVDAKPTPTAVEALGGSEIDADVLAAFMAARARA